MEGWGILKPKVSLLRVSVCVVFNFVSSVGFGSTIVNIQTYRYCTTPMHFAFVAMSLRAHTKCTFFFSAVENILRYKYCITLIHFSVVLMLLISQMKMYGVVFLEKIQRLIRMCSSNTFSAMLSCR